ncbi:MAG TPA: succinyl-diaminopimelate desuccinylase [Vicinamibacterales bacterium]|nr:succinyl-diaminopimelate desuccinylase [Vicinamibacterales bacterium]
MTTLSLAKQLIACRSLTPDGAGSVELLAARLTSAGFTCERIDRGAVQNLWAHHGSGRPLVCLAGHLDVVPPGPLDRWTSDPFTPTERNGNLYGRGAADMKVSVAAMITAAERFVQTSPAHPGTLAILLTTDEEGTGIDGTRAVVSELQARGTHIDACIVGEPTSSERFGDTVKNGRRGSLNGILTVKGVQCHIAYPERGRSPILPALPALSELAATEWDRGNEYFAPTSFQISDLHAGTGANNTIPGSMRVLFNFRFSTEWTGDRLRARVHETLDRHGVDYDLEWHLSGAPFLSPRGGLVDVMVNTVHAVTRVTPALSTGGGTSDGRFLAAISDAVVEFGPLNGSIHAIDEHVAVADVDPLSAVYEQAVAALLAR